MDTTGWITHCYGRFLIDLPPQAVILGAGYEWWGDSIKRLNETPESLTTLINLREQELKAIQRQKYPGSIFLRKLDLGKGSTGLLSWKGAHSTEMYLLDTYVVVAPTGRTYHQKSLVSDDREQRGIELATYLAHNLRSREPGEIPTESGFCIDGGYIAGSQFQSEGFDLGVSFPEHPGAHFSFSTSTGAEEDRLLERIDNFLISAVKLIAGIKTLRKGRHETNKIPGEEYLIAASDKGQRVYAFTWEFQGKDESVTEPQIVVDLSVLERPNDHDDSPPPPAFESDQQALDLWDAIISSIRLRPGAVDR